MPQEPDTRPLPHDPDSLLAGDGAVSSPPTRHRRRTWVMWGVGLGGLLAALAIGIAVLTLQPQNDAVEALPTSGTTTATSKPTPVASSTPASSEEPAPSESDTPPLQAPSDPTVRDHDVVAFTSFQPTGAAVLCADESQVHPITFTWQSQNAVAAWFGIDTNNAQAAPLQEVALSGSITWDFFCSNSSTTFTITIADANGALAHRSVVVERQ